MEMTRTHAGRGNPVAQQWYGELLYLENRDEEALFWFEKAAEQGQVSSWDKAGWQYEKGIGTEADLNKAICCYQNGAEGGSRMAQYNLGRLYFFGQGVEQDYKKAAKWLKEAVQRGRTYAKPLMGQCYLKGLGIQKNYELARIYFTDTPTDSHYYAMALNGLGEIYADGLGVPVDIPKGIEYFKQAAEKGSEEANENLTHFKKTIFGKWKKK